MWEKNKFSPLLVCLRQMIVTKFVTLHTTQQTRGLDYVLEFHFSLIQDMPSLPMIDISCEFCRSSHRPGEGTFSLVFLKQNICLKSW